MTRFSRHTLPIFSAGGHGEQLWHWHSLMLLIQHFLCRPQHCPPLQNARGGGGGVERLSWRVICLNHASSVSSRKSPPEEDLQKTFRRDLQRRFLWTHKKVYLAPNPVVGLLFQVGDAERFHQALGSQYIQSQAKTEQFW